MQSNKAKHFYTLPLALLLLCVLSPTFATSGGMTSAGAFGLGGPEDTGLREMVHLSAVGKLLSGRPQNSTVRLITVSLNAPAAETHIILRELIASNGTKTLAITAPESLTANLRRLQIFVEPTGHAFGMRRLGVDGSATIEPFRMQIGSDGAPAGKTLVGYSIGHPGVFEFYDTQLIFRESPAAMAVTADARSLIGGGYYRGFLPWIAAFSLMVLGWYLSRWALQETRGGTS